MEIYSDPETQLIKTSWYPCQVGARHKRAGGPLRPPTDCWINAGSVAARRLLACCATNTQPRPGLLRSAESWWGAAGSSTKGRILPERWTRVTAGFRFLPTRFQFLPTRFSSWETFLSEFGSSIHWWFCPFLWNSLRRDRPFLDIGFIHLTLNL